MKLEFYIELALLLIELLILIATAVFTFGGSLAAAGPIMVATRFAIQQILRRATKELVERTVKKSLQDKAKSRMAAFGQHTFREALEEGLQELGTSGGIQAYQISEGNRAGFDPKDLATAFGLGTLGGAVANVTSVGEVKATTMSGRFGEKAFRSATGEMLAETSIGIVTGQGVTWTSLGMAASSASVGSVMGDGQHVIDGRLTSDFIQWTADVGAPHIAATPARLPPALHTRPEPAPHQPRAPSRHTANRRFRRLRSGSAVGHRFLRCDHCAHVGLRPPSPPLPGDTPTGPFACFWRHRGHHDFGASGEPWLSAFPAEPTRSPEPPVNTDPSPRGFSAPPEPPPARSSWEPPRTVPGIGDDRAAPSTPSAVVAGAPLLSAATLTPTVVAPPDASPAGITPAGAVPPAGAAPPAGGPAVAAAPVAAPSVPPALAPRGSQRGRRSPLRSVPGRPPLRPGCPRAESRPTGRSCSTPGY